MSIKVLITRTVPRDKSREMIQLFREMRSLASKQDGYISGETMKSSDQQDEFLVISAWEKWLQIKEREMIQEKIDSLLGGKTEYKMYHHGFTS